MQENPTLADPRTFASESTQPELLGTQGIVRIALQLREHGYVPVRLQLVDRNFTPLEDMDAEEVSAVLLPLLRTSTEKEIVKTLLRPDIRGINVGALDLIDTQNKNGVVTVRQKGIITALSRTLATDLVAALNSDLVGG
ncbi:hypothetical protein [Rhodococcus qingshengii]|uniref:hypothetical protein n=1 Tax=Rhodococcus qingshengii TaxID=334542 RepID=UPI001C5DE06A|nr:hypothetical protein [Rhodococcus qingshengii]MBW4813190.1 hypothetical protein [Rhodococcus qingshengii]